jgi:alpha-ketoglutarate-dependent taurine dioxygenase
VIRVDADGDISGIHVNERQIGPLDMPGELIEPYYRALRRLLKAVYDPGLMITLPLAAGEGLLFDNQRVLHGRTAFIPEDPPRSVLTSSVDLEEFHSSIRMLRRELGHRDRPENFIQGMVV